MHQVGKKDTLLALGMGHYFRPKLRLKETLNSMGQILLISMGMQSLIKIFHMVQE